MKHLETFIISTFLALLTIGLNAQTFKIDTTVITYENKLRPCYATDIDPAPKVLQNAWEKYLKKGYGIKLKKSSSDKDVEKGTDVMIASISNKRMDIYSRISETATGSNFKVFAAFGYDIYQGDEGYEKEFDALGKLVRKFLLQHLNEYYTDEIKRTSKEIKSLKKNKLSKLKSISKNQGKIARKEKDIAVLESTQLTAKGVDAKAMEKQNKATAKKLKMENQNQEYSINIQNIDEKVLANEEKLEQLRLKFKMLHQ